MAALYCVQNLSYKDLCETEAHLALPARLSPDMLDDFIRHIGAEDDGYRLAQ